jgi:hypothetical protein
MPLSEHQARRVVILSDRVAIIAVGLPGFRTPSDVGPDNPYWGYSCWTVEADAVAFDSGNKQTDISVHIQLCTYPAR